jgi:hypothetical protein
MSVLDVMVLVVAIAVAAWVSRIRFVPLCSIVFLQPDIFWRTWSWYAVLLRHTQPLVATMTMAIAILRLLRPRPSIRRLTRQPGFAACSAASLAILVGGGFNYATTEITFAPGAEGAAGYTWVVLTPRGAEAGLAVAAAWLLLALGRRWQPEPAWIDRAGRIVGVYWIVMIPVSVLSPQNWAG